MMRATHVSVAANRGMQVYADGERVGASRRRSRSCLALPVVVGARRERGAMSEAADGVIFIHAFPLDGRMWDRQTERLRGRWPTIAPSLPGFGGARGWGT